MQWLKFETEPLCGLNFWKKKKKKINGRCVTTSTDENALFQTYKSGYGSNHVCKRMYTVHITLLGVGRGEGKN